jgi:ATP-binding cassette subfamily A (ABC1) protein 3
VSTLYPVSRLVKSAVEEKESKMKEIMEIMGLSSWVNNLAWFITAFVLFFWISLSSSFLCSTSFLPNSDSGLVFAYFFLFCMSEIPFCFLISVFFTRAKIAAIVGPVALFVALLPRFIFLGTNSYEQTSKFAPFIIRLLAILNAELMAGNKYLASLLSPSAFSFGADILSEYEYGGVGVQWHNVSNGSFSFASCLFMMFVDFILYSFLAWYLGQVCFYFIQTIIVLVNHGYSGSSFRVRHSQAPAVLV